MPNKLALAFSAESNDWMTYYRPVTATGKGFFIYFNNYEPTTMLVKYIAYPTLSFYDINLRVLRPHTHYVKYWTYDALQEQDGSAHRQQDSHHERSGVRHAHHQDVRLGEALCVSGFTFQRVRRGFNNLNGPKSYPQV